MNPNYVFDFSLFCFMAASIMSSGYCRYSLLKDRSELTILQPSCYAMVSITLSVLVVLPMYLMMAGQTWQTGQGTPGGGGMGPDMIHIGDYIIRMLPQMSAVNPRQES